MSTPIVFPSSTTNPYADQSHRKGCTCGRPWCALQLESIQFGIDLDAAFVADSCRSCQFWKRRDRRFGTCWHHEYPAPLTHQHDNCEFHAVRFILVEHAS